jgi:hypothetical protein
VRYATDGGFGGFTSSSVNGGSGGGGPAPPGTLVFLNTTTNGLRISQHLDFPPDATVHFGAVTVDDAATLALGGGTQLTVDGDFLVTGNSTVLATSKNGDGQVGGAWQGAGVTIHAGNVRVDSGSEITANGRGYLAGLGPGGAAWDGVNSAGGGGYGGVGASGNGPNAGGPTYGEASAPVDLGSGGGPAHAPAGAGGGAITLYAETLLLDGTIVANGSNGISVGCSGAAPGGGAGGSILVVATTLTGAGSLHADGGAGGEGGCTGIGDDGGGGGGGRIAVHYTTNDDFAGFTTATADGGRGGRPAEPGTILFINCGGDCNGDGRVTIDELVRMVSIALETSPLLACLAGDGNHDEAIGIDELVTGVTHALGTCGP